MIMREKLEGTGGTETEIDDTPDQYNYEVKVAPSTVEMTPPISNMVESEQANEKKADRIKMPFGINRYVVLICYTFFCFFVGPAFFSWASMRTALRDTGAYEWKCDKLDFNQESRSYINPETKMCKDSEEAINFLYTIATSSMFICSGLSGFALDIYGPKIVSMSGVSIMILGYTLLAKASETFQSYIPAYLFIGMGTDAAFYGVLGGSAILPGYGRTILSVFGAARSMSFYIALIIESVVTKGKIDSFTGIGMIFAFGCLLPCLIVAVFLIPWKTFEPIKDESSLSFDIDPEKTSKGGDNMVAQKTYPALDDTENSMEKKKTYSSMFADSFQSMMRKTCHAAGLYLKSPYYFTICLVMMLSLQRIIFFTLSTGNVYDSEGLSFFKIVNPLSFLPCPLIGWVADKYGVMLVMFLVNITGLMTVVCSMLPSMTVHYMGWQIISVLCYTLNVSFLLSQLYCYAEDTFPPKDQGKVIGSILTLSGLVLFSTQPMYDFSLTKNSFFEMMLYEILASLFVAGLLLVAWYYKHYRSRTVDISAKLK